MKKMIQCDTSFLFADFWGCVNGDSFTGFPSVLARQEDSIEPDTNYLHKEERILTLARDRYKKVLGSFSLSFGEEKVYETVPQKNTSLGEIVTRISRCVTRPLLKEISSGDCDAVATILKLVEFPTIKLSFFDSSEIPEVLIRNVKYSMRKKWASQDEIIGISFKEAGMDVVKLVGAKITAHPQSVKNCFFYSCPDYFITDLADFLSYLIVYVQVMREILKIRNGEGSVYKEAFKERMNSFRRRFLLNHVRLNSMVAGEDSRELTRNFSLREDAWETLLDSPVFADKWANISTEVADILERNVPHFTMDIPRNKYEEIVKPNMYYADVLGSDGWFDFATCFFMSDQHILSYRSFCNAWRDKKYGVSAMPYYKSAHGYGHEECRVALLADLFCIIAEEKHQICMMSKHYRELEGEYAKSYMTKKINVAKVLSAMEKSMFNQYFGFVEYDEETKLADVEVVAKEFQAVKETYLRGVDSSGNVIRFRKLGQHKALGLYYPALSCLCVDIRSPESLMHEFGHLIDFTYDNLSLSEAFRPVKGAYKDLFESYLVSLSTDSSEKKVFCGNTKYNKDYYLTPTESFARCFELYISKCLGVRNSIVPDTFKEGIYPQSDGFLESVKNYFDNLLHDLETVKKEKLNMGKSGGKAAGTK